VSNATTQRISVRDAIRQALDEEMARDERVFVIGEEVAEYQGAYKVTKGLLQKYGAQRVVDTPISEGSFTGLAIGAAMTGLRPVVEFMSWNFSFVAADQIISNAAKTYYMTGGRYPVPIVLRGPNGAAAQVSCQHSHCVEALYANLPGLIVIAPSNSYDSKGLLKSAIRNNNPVLFLENEMLYGDEMEIPVEEYLVPIGKAQIIRPGAHVTLVAHSRMVKACIEVAAQCARQGIDVELIDLRTIKPLDLPTLIASVQKTHCCVLVEEGHYFAGISAEIACALQQACFDYLDHPIERVCQRETPMPYSRVLEAETIPTVGRILDAVERAVRRS